ncbi:hypothetical protein FOS14_09770 [Skermania sp. ID1734]|uniref:hypothetical protein n=1 Tax=Skermania sp. ID1734 TaxID=2597516 RepID=UPI00117C880C|nr:hypothetical protein [Skermania sp. ID1734]TSE00091.1 hypothetical protein FOS14_09770 [Skermania sp. ID1734]
MWQIIGVLVVIAIVIKLWPLFLAVAMGWLAYKLAPPVLAWHRRRRDTRTKELDAIRARADQQHQWYLVGDARGIYGRYPPAR